MASNINGVTIVSTSGSPTIQYGVTYSATRLDNASVQYNFTIKSSFKYPDGATLGNGYKLTCNITVANKQGYVVLKDTYDAEWKGSGTKSTKYLSIVVPSSSANENQTVTFQVVNKSNVFDGKSGEVTTTNYYVTSPSLLTTKCGQPTNLTATPNPFTKDVVLTWSGASNGTYNSIVGYEIQYIISASTNEPTQSTDWEYANNAPYWRWCASVQTTHASASCTIDFSSVPNGSYIKFRILTKGSAGDSYYSDWKYFNNVIRKIPYTSCIAPTAFVVTPDDTSTDGFNTTLTLEWSGANGGTNNAIESYQINYCISIDGNTWGDWSLFRTISTNNTYGNLVVDVSSYVPRGYFVLFQIRTQGSVGNNYYSDYVDCGDAVLRNLRTKCVAPRNITLTSGVDLSGKTHNDIFENTVVMKLSNAASGDNNELIGYEVEYRLSDDKDTWGDWEWYGSPSTTNTSYSYTMSAIANKVKRGQYVQFRVRSVGIISNYESDYVSSDIMRRNSQPSKISSIGVNLTEYSYGDNLIIQWDIPNDVDNNIYKYKVRLFPNNDGEHTSLYYDYETTNAHFTFEATSDVYKDIYNNQTLRFAVKPIDIFGVDADFTSSPQIMRYDNTGMMIGVNGRWINCQVYYGVNGVWVEQEPTVGIDDEWVECGV